MIPLALRFCCIALAASLAAASSAHAVDYFVRVAGSDHNDGRTPATAFASIRHAAAQVQNAGDRIIVGPGTYREGDIGPARSGIESRPVVFLADSSGQLTGDPPGEVWIDVPPDRGNGFLIQGRRGVLVDGFSITGAPDHCVQTRVSADGLVAPEGIVFRNIRAVGCAKRGFDITAVGNVTIEDSLAIDNNSGITVAGPGTAGREEQSVLGRPTIHLRNNQVRGNHTNGIFLERIGGGTVSAHTIADNGGTGILVRSSTGVRIESTRIERNDDGGIVAGRGVTDAVAVEDFAAVGNVLRANDRSSFAVVANGVVHIENNSIVDSQASGISVVSPLATADVTILGNEIIGTIANGVFVDRAAEARVDGNTIDLAGFVGASLTNVASADVSRNAIRRSAQDAVRITGGGPVVARDNSLSQNPDSGFLLEADPDKAFHLDITGNTIASPTHGFFVRGCAGGQIADNVVTNSVFDAVLLRRCTGVSVLRNQFVDNGRHGIAINHWMEPYGRDFAIRGNRIRNSGGPGVQIYARGNVVATRNEIRASGSTGLSIETAGRARVMLSNNEITIGGAHGLFLAGASKGMLQNSILHSHQDTGATMRFSPNMLIANNLIYANRSDGLAIGTGRGPSPKPVVINNTIYGNDNRGLVIGSGDDASPGGIVMNNIVEANAGTGIAIDRQSSMGLDIGFNINSDGYGPDTPRSPFDLPGPAGLISPAGPDGRLGGLDDADDNFRLRQVRGGQTQNARAIDAGSADTVDIGLTGSTAVNGVADIGPVDVGFHYGASLRQRIVPAQAFVVLFVRADGDDSRNGRTPTTAYRSIRRAALQGITGATVIVGPGVYVEPEPIRIRRGADRVTFLADPLGQFTGDAPGPVVVDAAGGENAFIVFEAAEVTIDGFHVTNAATAGIQIRDGGDGSVVRNNVVFSNNRRGIEVRGADDVLIDNNLVYANGTGGIQLQQASGTVVTGNTVYGNAENGITVGGGLSMRIGLLAVDHDAGRDQIAVQLASPTQVYRAYAGDAVRFQNDPGYYRVVADSTSVGGLLDIRIDPPLGRSHTAGTEMTDEKLAAVHTRVQRNIVASNAIGIQVRMNSLQGYQCGYNVVPEGMPVQVPLPGHTPRCDGDIIANPHFVQPAGPDGVLGGRGFADDNFRLIQEISPAVDLAPCSIELPGVAGTTHPQGLPDECPIDSGYHYPLPREDPWGLAP